MCTSESGMRQQSVVGGAVQGTRKPSQTRLKINLSIITVGIIFLCALAPFLPFGDNGMAGFLLGFYIVFPGTLLIANFIIGYEKLWGAWAILAPVIMSALMVGFDAVVESTYGAIRGGAWGGANGFLFWIGIVAGFVGLFIALFIRYVMSSQISLWAPYTLGWFMAVVASWVWHVDRFVTLILFFAAILPALSLLTGFLYARTREAHDHSVWRVVPLLGLLYFAAIGVTDYTHLLLFGDRDWRWSGYFEGPLMYVLITMGLAAFGVVIGKVMSSRRASVGQEPAEK